MEEKKLTDEEIVKALEHCATENTCRGCVKHNGETTIDYFKCMRDTRKNVVDLFHRLQAENERLNDMKFTQEHCDLYKENELLKSALKRELAEHEEFTKKAKEKIEYYKDREKSFVNAVEKLTKEKSELKSEIKRLTDFKNQVTLFGLYGAGLENGRKQAVKDTAKEILTELIEKAHSNACIDLTVNEVKAWFREDYGVEVE